MTDTIAKKLRTMITEKDAHTLALFVGQTYDEVNKLYSHQDNLGFKADPEGIVHYFSQEEGQADVEAMAVEKYFVLYDRGGESVLVTADGDLLKAHRGGGTNKYLSLVDALVNVLTKHREEEGT